MRNYLTVQEIIEIHKTLISEFGGSHGLRDFAMLESALDRPKNGYYKNIFEEAAALMESLANNHPFLDGNKRVAFFSTDIFLRMNGNYISCNNDEAYKYFRSLFGKNSFKYSNLLNWLEKNVVPLNR